MSELPERCFRNAVELTETINRSIGMLEKGAKSRKEQEGIVLAIADASQWLDLSKQCIPDDIYKSLSHELSSDVMGPEQMAIPSMRQRILDSLYNVRRDMRTPYGLWKVDDKTGNLATRDPYTGQEIKE